MVVCGCTPDHHFTRFRVLSSSKIGSLKTLRSVKLFLRYFCVGCVVLTWTMRRLRSSYVDNARNMRRILVIVRENVAAIAFIDSCVIHARPIRSSLVIVRRLYVVIRGSYVVH